MDAANTSGTILIVDSDDNTSELLRRNLTSEGYGVVIVPKAKDVNFSKAADCRIVIIDAMDQEYNGIDLCADLKSHEDTASLPIIVSTERDSEDVIVDAFDNGADDFVSKPFSLREFIARIKAVLRRHPVIATDKPVHKVMSFPDMGMAIDPESQKVTVADGIVPLTKTEYAILIFLIQNRNSFFTRIDICNEVWKEDASSNTRIVDTNISRLRKKLGDSGKYIINRYGMGYAFVDKISQ